MMRRLLLLVCLLCVGFHPLNVHAKPICVDGMCYPSEAAARAAGVDEKLLSHTPPTAPAGARVWMGLADAPTFLAFLENKSEPSSLGDHAFWLILLIVLVGGLAANLTPCVLPLVPVNLILVGRGWQRGLAYALGITLAYGALGLAASLSGFAFGSIQSNPWFSASVACVMILLACAISGLFPIDLAKYRPKHLTSGGPFLLGVGAATLAGACVEPILLATLVLTAQKCAAGAWGYLVLPFVLGAGMGLPWPFAAAGLAVLPRPGAWMRWVNRLFALIFLMLASHYCILAYHGFQTSTPVDAVTPTTWSQAWHNAQLTKRPIFVDVHASWCKNCTHMARTTLKDPRILKSLQNFTVLSLQAEDFDAFRSLPEFRSLNIKGLPAFIIFNSPLDD